MSKRKVKMTKELEKFLRSKRVYAKFCKNVNNFMPVEDKEFDDIIMAFGWEGTDEGARFWYNLDDEFEQRKV